MEKKKFWKIFPLPYSIIFSFLATLAAKNKSSLTSLFHSFFGFVPLLQKRFLAFSKKKAGQCQQNVDILWRRPACPVLAFKKLALFIFSLVFYGIAANGSERAAPFPEQSSAFFSKNVYEKTVNDARITGVIHKCALSFLRDFLKRKSESVLRNSVWYNSASMVKYL